NQSAKTKRGPSSSGAAMIACRSPCSSDMLRPRACSGGGERVGAFAQFRAGEAAALSVVEEQSPLFARPHRVRPHPAGPLHLEVKAAGSLSSRYPTLRQRRLRGIELVVLAQDAEDVVSQFFHRPQAHHDVHVASLWRAAPGARGDAPGYDK